MSNPVFEKHPNPVIEASSRINQEHWEWVIKHYMNKFGWTLDVDNETTLGFTFTVSNGMTSSRDYNKQTRSFVHIHDINHRINLVCTKEVSNEGS